MDIAALTSPISEMKLRREEKDTYSDWSRSSAGFLWTCCRDGALRAPVLSLGSGILCSGCSNPSLKTGSGWDSVPQRPHSHTSYGAGRQQGIIIKKRTIVAHAGTHDPCGFQLATSRGRNWGCQTGGNCIKIEGKVINPDTTGTFGIFLWLCSPLFESKPNKKSRGVNQCLCSLIGCAQFKNII